MTAAGQALERARGRWPAVFEPARKAGPTGVALAMGLVAALLGIALMFVSVRFGEFGPLAAVALPLAPLLAVVVLARPMIGVIAVFATMPLGALGVPAGPITLQIVEIAVFVLGVVVVLRRLALAETPLPWSPLFAFPLALIAWTLVALYSALDETLAVKQIASLTGGVIFAATVVAACHGTGDVRRVLASLAAVSAGIAVLALSSGARLESSYGGSRVAGRLEGAFDHPNQLGSFVAMAAAILIGLAAGSRTRRARFLSVVTLVLVLTTLTLSLSRGAWIGAAVAVLFLLVTLKEARRMMLALSIPIAVVGFFIWSSEADRPEVKVVGERARAIAVRSPYDGRDQIWAEAIREIREDPITGQGPGSFPLASARAASEAASVSPAHAHNLFLNWAAETGVPAAIILAGFVFAIGRATRHASRAALARGDPRDRAVVLGIAAALLSVLAQGFFDYVISNSVLHITVWGLIGALIVAQREGSAPAEEAARRRSGPGRRMPVTAP